MMIVRKLLKEDLGLGFLSLANILETGKVCDVTVWHAFKRVNLHFYTH